MELLFCSVGAYPEVLVGLYINFTIVSLDYRIYAVHVYRHVTWHWYFVRLDRSYSLFRIFFSLQCKLSQNIALRFNFFASFCCQFLDLHLDFNLNYEKSFSKRSTIRSVCWFTVYGFFVLRMGRIGSVPYESKYLQYHQTNSCQEQHIWNKENFIVSHFTNCFCVFIRFNQWRRYVCNVYNNVRTKSTSCVVRQNLLIYFYNLVHLYRFIIVYFNNYGRLRSC